MQKTPFLHLPREGRFECLLVGDAPVLPAFSSLKKETIFALKNGKTLQN